MTVTTRIVGRDRLSAALASKAKQYERAAAAGLQAWALLVRNNAVTAIQKGPKSGRAYQRGTVTHRASAPGQAPATDTGNLAASIGWNVDAGTLTAEVFASAAYAVHLELGTRNMEPRPFMVPALEASRKQGLSILKATLARAA